MGNLLPAIIVIAIVFYAVTKMSPDSKVGKIAAPIVGGAAVLWEQILGLVQGLM